MAEALYRKYRPQTFSDVVGQEHIETTIRHALERDQLSHAYLFCGPRGTGKTTTARLLAKALLCEKAPTPKPDGTCESCLEIAEGRHPDVYELDAASRTGVENVREEIIGRVQFAPTRGSYKVYIIDEVHMLSIAAFNALLKTLEEPPAHVVFILCTTDPERVPETIHSRCQRFDFKRIGQEGIVERLAYICEAEGVSFEPEALELISAHSDGGMRNALTTLEQSIAFGEGRVSAAVVRDMVGAYDPSALHAIVSALSTRDAATAFTWLAQFVEEGGDISHFVGDLSAHVRTVYLYQLIGDEALASQTDEMRALMLEESKALSTERLVNILSVLSESLRELKTSQNPRLSFEIALARLMHPESDLTVVALAERVAALERRLVQYMSGSALPVSSARPPEASAQPVASSRAESPEEMSKSVSDEALASHRSSSTQARASSTQAEPMPVGAPLPKEGPSVLQSDASAQSSRLTTAPPAGGSSGEDGLVVYGEPTELPSGVMKGLHNPAALQRLWQKILQKLKTGKPAYAAMFLHTSVHYSDEQSCLVVEFTLARDFVAQTVHKPEVVSCMAACIKECSTAAIPFAFATKPANAAPASSTPSSPAKPAMPDFAAMKPQQFAEPSSPTPAPASQPSPVYEDEVPLDAYGEAPGYEVPEDVPFAGAREIGVQSTSHASVASKPYVDTQAKPEPLAETEDRASSKKPAQASGALEALKQSPKDGDDTSDQQLDAVIEHDLYEPVLIRKGSRKTAPKPIAGLTAREIQRQRFNRDVEPSNAASRAQVHEQAASRDTTQKASDSEQAGKAPTRDTSYELSAEEKDALFADAPSSSELKELLSANFGSNVIFEDIQ